MPSTTSFKAESLLVELAFPKLCDIIDSEAFVPSKAPESQRKKVFWKIGECLASFETDDSRQEKAFVKALGIRLNKKYRKGFSGNTLTEALRTYRTFPDYSQIENDLTWRHYVDLSKVDDEARRSLLLDKAKQRGWDEYELSRYTTSRSRNPWEGTGCIYHDSLVMSFAIAYATTCGVIPVETLCRIYKEDVEAPADDFDIQETFYYLREHARNETLPSLWNYEGKTYIVDRSIANGMGNERFNDPFHTRDGLDSYYYRDPYGSDDEAEMRATFLNELKLQRRQRAFWDAARLARRWDRGSFKRLDLQTIERGVRNTPLNTHAVSRLMTLLCDPMPSDIDPETGLSEVEEAVLHALSRLTRHISATGLPSREEIQMDALFLLSLMWTSRPSEAIPELVAHALRDIYSQIPLWTLGGYSQHDLEEGQEQCDEPKDGSEGPRIPHQATSYAYDPAA